MIVQLAECVNLGVVDPNVSGILVPGVGVDLPYYPGGDRILVVLGYNVRTVTFLQLIFIKRSHADHSPVQRIGREIRPPFRAVAPERAVGHQAPEVKYFLPKYDLFLRYHCFPGRGLEVHPWRTADVSGAAEVK